MHMPPPVHGAAMMGQYIHDSKLINDTFECMYINPSLSKEVSNVGKVNVKKISLFIRNLYTIIQTILNKKPQLVYFTPTTNDYGIYRDMIIVITLKLLRRKIILHLHNKGVKAYSKSITARLAYRIIFKNTKVILLSKHLFRDIEDYAKPNNIFICPNGIPVTLDNPVERCQPHTPYRFLFLSNMIESKGVLVLLKACRMLKDKGYRFVCDFVGKWSDITEEDFNRHVEELGISGCIYANGPKYGKEKEAFLASSDALVFPTCNEAFGLVLLEGMEFGLPCISTHEGGIPDIIVNETGFIVPCKDHQALAEKMMWLIEHPSESIRMGRNGRKRFEEKFTTETFENNITTILNSMVQ